MKRINFLLLPALLIIIMLHYSCCISHCCAKDKNTEVVVIDTVPVKAKAFHRAPLIVFTDTVRNLTIVHGSVMPIAFSLRNAGDSALVISNVEPSCDCMTVISFPKTVAPGEQAEINITYDPRDETGVVWRTIDVSTNARVTPITLTLNIDIVQGGEKK
jgi:hypothetical protein